MQRLHDPSSSNADLSTFPALVSQPHGLSAPNSSFFQGSVNCNASHSAFNQVGRDQYMNIYNNANEEMEDACLNKLPHAIAAGYKSGNHKTCLIGTREAVLREIEIWEVDKTNESVYWLKALAGCGKSTIAQTVAEISAANGRLGASFFCSRDFPDRRNLRLIFPTLAYDVAYRFPAFKTALVSIIRSNPNIEHYTLAVQLEKLLVQPLKQTRIPFTIVIDALDECEDKEPVSAFLSALARYIDELPTIKFFITGRPEDHIRSGFVIPSLRTKEFPLHDVDSATVDLDIKSYVETGLNEIATRRKNSISGPWPSDKDIAAILNKCSGLFIIASIIIGFIDFPFDTPQNRLKMILDVPDSTMHEGRSGADVTYSQVFAASFKEVEEDMSQFSEQLRLVLGSIILAFKPLSRASLAKILGVSSETIWNVLFRLHSVLIVPESDSEAIRICHKSFADFITDRQRCSEIKYYIDAPAHHLELGVRSWKLMESTLMKNICRLPSYVMNDEVKDLDARREKYVGVPLAYACSSWAKHIRFGAQVDDGARVIVEVANCFLERHFLSWLEVLSVEGDFGVAVHSLHDIKSCLTDINITARNLMNLIYDCERFVQRFFDVMERSATHIYHSALPWSPSSSLPRKLYESELKVEAKLLNAVDATWDACIRIVSVDMCADEIIYSHHGGSIAVREGSCLKVFDTMTGASRAVFMVHEFIYSVAFSFDDNLLACGLSDGTLNIWDLQTGVLIRTLVTHTNGAFSVVFSPCGSMIAFCTHAKTIPIWNISSGSCECVLEGNSDIVKCVCWSTENQVISGSYDGTVRAWDISKPMSSKILHKHADWVAVVISSPRSFLVASVSDDGTAIAYDLRSGDVIQTISVTGNVNSMRFSTNGNNVMYTNSDSGCIWNIARGERLSSVCFHGYAAFSPDGTCFASRFGRFVKICKTESRGERHHEKSAYRHHERVKDVSFLPDGQLMLSRTDVVVKVWDAVTGICLVAFGGNAKVISVAVSPNSVFFACLLVTSLNSKSDTTSVEIRDVCDPSLVKSIKVDHGTRRIEISPDSRSMLSLSQSSFVLWDLESGTRLTDNPWPHHTSLTDDILLTFSTDGRNVKFIKNSIRRLYHYDPASVFSVLEEEERLRPLEKPYRCERDSEWIVDQHSRRRVLWLPPEERPWSSDSRGKKVVVGCKNDKVYIVDFSAPPPFSS